MSITTGTPSTASSTGHTFVSYARDDSSFAMQVAEGLRARDVPIWIDQWNIDPGANWSRSLDAALSACASFLIILSPDAVASDEVQGELRFALNARKPIVPLLFRPCEIPRPLLLRQYVDFTQSTDVSGASLDRLARALRDGRADVFPPSTHDRSNRLTLLQDVKDEAVERLGSIGADTPAPILLEAQPHQVARP